MKIKFCVSESVFPSGENTAISLFYLAARKIPNIQILPEKDDNFPTRLVKSAALFISGCAMHYFAYAGTIWHGWGVASNGTIVLLMNFLDKEKFFGLKKVDFLSAAKLCMAQGIISLATYHISPWVLGLFSASYAFYSWLAPNYGIEQLQKRVTEYIVSKIYPPEYVSQLCE